MQEKALIQRPPDMPPMMDPITVQIKNAKASVDLVAPVPRHETKDMACNYEIIRQTEDAARQ